MMYYSTNARQSAIKHIKQCAEKVGTINGNELSYLDARAISDYLYMLINEIEKEEERGKRNGI